MVAGFLFRFLAITRRAVIPLAGADQPASPIVGSIEEEKSCTGAHNFFSAPLVKRKIDRRL